MSDNSSAVKNNSGVKRLLVVLIVLVLCVLGLLCYQMFLGDKEDSQKESREVSKNTVEEVKKIESDVPIEDTFTVYVSTRTVNPSGKMENLLVTTFYLKDGKVYEYRKIVNDPNSIFHYTYPFVEGQPNGYDEDMEVKEVQGLPSIKRIKGITNIGTDVSGDMLLVVAENGEVYTYDAFRNGEIKKANFLDDYKVDDIVSYYVIGACTSGPNVKTCGGEYHIIDQDGNHQHYVVNQDGTLNKK